MRIDYVYSKKNYQIYGISHEYAHSFVAPLRIPPFIAHGSYAYKGVATLGGVYRNVQLLTYIALLAMQGDYKAIMPRISMITHVQTIFIFIFVYVGEIGMSKDLDDLSTALFNGELPAMWRKMTSQVLLMFMHQTCELGDLCRHSS